MEEQRSTELPNSPRSLQTGNRLSKTYLVKNALLLAYVAGVVVLHQVVVELGGIVVTSLAKLATGVAGLSQLRIAL